MSRRQAVYREIAKRGSVPVSLDLLGVAGVQDEPDLNHILFSLQRHGKIKFRESHKDGHQVLTNIKPLHQSKKEAKPEVLQVEQQQDPVNEDSAAVEAVEAATETTEKKSQPDVILRWLTEQKPDQKGWVMCTTGEIAGYTGIETGYISAVVNNLEKRGVIEILRVAEGSRNRIIGIRTAEAKKAEQAEKINNFKRSLWHVMPETPLLDEYESAKHMSETSPWLQFAPDPLYEEAWNLKEHLRHVLEDDAQASK